MTEMLTFEDGETRARPTTLTDRVTVVGKTDTGLLCVIDPSMPDMPYALTPCCNASGTGTESGLACRGCYGDAPWECADIGPHLVDVKIAEPAFVQAKKDHHPMNWFVPGMWPACSCGFAPKDNFALNNHWAEHGLAWFDHHGQLRAKVAV